MTQVGIDGYARGWVAVGLAEGAFVRAWVAPSLDELLAGCDDGATVAIDIPIGGVDRGWRTADVAARAALGARRASVFAVPPRPVWTITGYAAANALCRELTGAGLSVQAFRLLPKMLEADRHPGLYEVHPELVFHRLNRGPLPYGKKTWNGQQARRRLLAEAGVGLPDDLGPAGVAPADDVLDAAAAAHGAYRIARSVAVALPEVAEFDRTGRRIAIWS